MFVVTGLLAALLHGAHSSSLSSSSLASQDAGASSYEVESALHNFIIEEKQANSFLGLFLPDTGLASKGEVGGGGVRVPNAPRALLAIRSGSYRRRLSCGSEGRWYCCWPSGCDECPKGYVSYHSTLSPAITKDHSCLMEVRLVILSQPHLRFFGHCYESALHTVRSRALRCAVWAGAPWSLLA
jgi:hypothetical protein